MLMAELAAQLKSQGKSLHEKLDDLYWQHGLHAERLINLGMEDGEPGARKKAALMAIFREKPPTLLGGMPVAVSLDFENQRALPERSSTKEYAWPPRADMVILELAEPGNYLAVRPSGTENKVKIYLFACLPAEQLYDLDVQKAELETRLDALSADLAGMLKSL
jgi:phosphoglucomutase/phosphomannomutase